MRVICITQNHVSVGVAPSLAASISPLHAKEILRFEEEPKAKTTWLTDLFAYFIKQVPTDKTKQGNHHTGTPLASVLCRFSAYFKGSLRFMT